MCGGTPVIPALRMQKEENHKFKHILDYIVRPCQRREDTKWYKEDRRFFHEIVIEKTFLLILLLYFKMQMLQPQCLVGS